MLQVYQKDGSTDVLKTYIINMSGCPNLKKQLFTEVQIFSKMTAEIQYNLKKKVMNSKSTHKAYADDSMKLVERPIYDKNVDIKRTNDYELNGFFTSACVHGGMLRETLKSGNSQVESYFGWANSNPIGCTFAGPGEVDIMVFRTLGNNDQKGVNDKVRETHVISTAFQFYIDKTPNGVMFHKVRANTKLNEPYAVFPKDISVGDIQKMGEQGFPKHTS